MNVWIYRRISVSRDAIEAQKYPPIMLAGGFYVRALRLPLAPFPGLLLPIERGSDPLEVEWVMVSSVGAVVCGVECVPELVSYYDDEPSAIELIAEDTKGWTKLPLEFAHYHIEPPPDPSPTLADWYLGEINFTPPSPSVPR